MLKVSLALALALWTCLSVQSVLALCLPCPVCLPSGPCIAFWIYLGSGSLVPMVLSLLGCSCACQLLAGGKVRVVEQHIVGDRFKLGLLLGWGALLYTVAYICSWSPNI